MGSLQKCILMRWEREQGKRGMRGLSFGSGRDTASSELLIQMLLHGRERKPVKSLLGG